ncbi:MAG TPA: response regulator transcription factor [Chroococcales cyanobacterium]
MKPISVVIIEDHEATLKGLKSELSQEADIDVLAIATGSEDGLRLALDLKPDVVLLDLHLPDSPGPKSLTEKFCALPNSSIIVFSGDTRAAILNLVMGAGVSGYLLKSEPIARVAQAIRDVINGNSPVVSAELSQSHVKQPRITKTEQELLKMLARGMKYQEIASTRFTSAETVRKQVDSLLEKLELNSREELIAWAAENGYGKVELEL